MNFNVKNPIFMSASPFTDGLDNIKMCFSWGIGGVFTKTILIGEKRRSGREYIYISDSNIYNSTTYSKYNEELWLHWLAILYKQAEYFVIPNIWGNDMQNVFDYVVRLEKIGVKIIELGISCPNDIETTSDEQIMWLISKIITYTKVKISVKLVADSDIIKRIAYFVSCGVNIFTISDSFPACYVNRDKIFNVGYSGKGIKAIVLRKILDVKAEFPDITICGGGGIQSYQDIKDYFMVGADYIQLCSVAYTKGGVGIKKIVQDYIEGNKYKSS